MGVCTSSNKRKKKEVVKIKKKDNYNGEIVTSREPKLKGLDIIGKLDEKELRRCNTNKTDCDNSHKKLNVYKCQSTFQNLETFEMMMNTENIPLSSFKEKKILKEDNIKTETSEKKSDKESNNFININFKEDNTIASIRMNEKNIINKNISLEDIPKEIENDKNILNSKDNYENNKKEIINEIKDNIEKKENEDNNKNENLTKNENEDKKETNCIDINDLKKSNNNVNPEKNIEIKNEVKNNERIIEDDTFSNITFLKDINNINIKKNNYKMNFLNNNNYYSYKGNLFNLNSEVIDINKE